MNKKHVAIAFAAGLLAAIVFPGVTAKIGSLPLVNKLPRIG